jgi:hypothetical protein
MPSVSSSPVPLLLGGPAGQAANANGKVRLNIMLRFITSSSLIDRVRADGGWDNGWTTVALGFPARTDVPIISDHARRGANQS